MTNRINFKISFALALALAAGVGVLSVAPLAAQAAEAPKNSVTRKFVKPIQEAQAALQAKDFPKAIEQLRTVEAAPDRSPYDTFVVNQLLGIALVQSQQNAAAIPYFEGMISSGFLEPNDSQLYSREIVKLLYGDKQYAKAAEAGRKVIASGAADEDTYLVVSQAEFLNKNYPGVVEVLAPRVKQAEASGTKLPEATLQLLSEAYIRQNDMANAAGPLRLLVTHYPSPQH
ncbi:MAG: hypothetical protein EON93_19645, partial [Burkholderiales bacterium]